MNGQRYNGPVVLKMWSLDRTSASPGTVPNTKPRPHVTPIKLETVAGGLAVGVLTSPPGHSDVL